MLLLTKSKILCAKARARVRQPELRTLEKVELPASRVLYSLEPSSKTFALAKANLNLLSKKSLDLAVGVATFQVDLVHPKGEHEQEGSYYDVRCLLN